MNDMLNVFTLFLSLGPRLGKVLSMDTPAIDPITGLPVVPAATAATAATGGDPAATLAARTDAVAKVADAETTSEGSLSDVVEKIGGLGAGALDVLSDLHILDGKLAEKGISIVELLTGLAKAFGGVHL